MAGEAEMSEAFDPYHAWLAIPPSRRPPSPYDLLGIREGETDLARIREAAAARYARIRTFTLGPKREHALKLQNEVSEALVFLTKDVPEDAVKAGPAPVTPNATAQPDRPPPPPLAQQSREAVSRRPELKPRSTLAPILTPVCQADGILRSIAGEENTILHGFLRGAAAVAVLLVFLGLVRTVSTLSGQPPHAGEPIAVNTPLFEDAIEPEVLPFDEAVDELPDPQAGVEAVPREPDGSQPPESREKPSRDEPQPTAPEPEPPEQQPKPEPPVVEASTPLKPEPGGPLQALAEAVDLPEWNGRKGSTTGPPAVFTIGQIQSEPDVPWQLFLLGGHAALKQGRAFLFQSDEPRQRQPAWLVQLETSNSGGSPTRKDAAKIWRDQNALRFQWAEKAPTNANCLRNCILLIRVGAESKYVALTEPKTVDPVPIDLDRDELSRRVPVRSLPRSGSLRVEITSVEGWEGYVVDPPGPAEAKTPMELRFTRTDRHGGNVDQVAFRLSFAPKSSDLQVNLKMLSPKAATFERLKRGAQGQRQGLDAHREAMARLLGLMDKEKKRRANAQPLPNGRGGEENGGQQDRLDRDKELDALETKIWYIDFYNTVHRKAKIHFRLFTEIDGHRVVLAST
ncbi:MAG: hypothetical protein HQ582_27085 [Planctomycetes bacterium]|nr:hypothetical protein [Planctomycetota bacterium]